MDKCPKIYKKVLKLFKIYQKHEDVVCNFVLDLDNANTVDLIVQCRHCLFKRVVSSTIVVLKESITLFPSAFTHKARKKGEEYES